MVSPNPQPLKEFRNLLDLGHTMQKRLKTTNRAFKPDRA